MNEKTGRGGRPRLPIDAATVAKLRDEGHSWRAIARQVGVGYGTVRRAYQLRAKTVPKPIPEPSTIGPDCQKAKIPIFGFVRLKRRRRFLVALVAFLAVVPVARSQGGVPASPILIVDSLGRPRAGVTVTICTSAGVGAPCAPLASIFVDAGLTTPAANPQTTDGRGNLPVFYAAPGTYTYTVTGAGITPSGPFTATVARTGGGNVLLGSPNTFTAANTFTGPTTLPLPHSLTNGGFTNSLAGTVTAARTWTLQDASDTFVFRATSDTLTNKTFDISANTLKAVTNTAGHVPRNNGTQYVDAQLGFSDLSGVASTSQIGTGTPSAGQYVDGGTGAWTAIPATGATEFTLSATVPSAVSLTVACVEGGTGLCNETVFAKAHTLVRLTYNLTQAPATCATNAVLDVRDMTSSSNLTTITVNQSPAQFVDSGALSIATTAGHKILVGTLTAASGCGTVPNVTSVTAAFQ